MTALRETIKDVFQALFQTLHESYKQQKRTLKTVRLTRFQKLKLQSASIRIQFSSSLSIHTRFLFSSLFIPSFIVLSCYFCFTQFGESSLGGLTEFR